MFNGQSHQEEHHFFDGELPAELLASFPVTEVEPEKRLRPEFTDTHQYAVERRYPDHRLSDHSERHFRYHSSDLTRNLSSIIGDAEPSVVAWIGLGTFLMIFLLFVAITISLTTHNSGSIGSNTALYCVVSANGYSKSATIYSEPSESSEIIGRLGVDNPPDLLGRRSTGDSGWYEIDMLELGVGWVKDSDAVLVGDGC